MLTHKPLTSFGECPHSLGLAENKLLNLEPNSCWVGDSQEEDRECVSIDFICKIYGKGPVHGVITVCMLGYYNDVLIQVSFVFLALMTSCPSLQHARAGLPLSISPF